MRTLPAFTLVAPAGEEHSFPTGRPALIAFVKEDCPTCNVAMPVIDALFKAHGDNVDFFVAGQTIEGNATLIETHGLTVPILDDSALKVSFEYDIDTVPTLYWANSRGEMINEVIGFVRDEWQWLNGEISKVTGGAPAAIDWDSLPEWRPGCGSLSVDPVIADRLRAEASNSPLRARSIDIAPADDEFEFMFDQGFTDGLPVIPPTPERVIRMLSGTRRDAQDIVAQMPPNMGDVTVEKIAINAVMAGCKPEYMPVLIAGIEAICTDEFNIHGVMATTMGAAPVMVINGPIRHKLDMNMKLGALGQGNRANATMGRALRLIVRNVGGAIPGGTERSTLSNPMKFTMCFAEWEERSNWAPLHVERGFAPDESVITVFAMTSGPVQIVDQDSRDASQIAGSMGMSLESVFHPKMHRAGIDTLLVVCPEHVDTLSRGNYSKADLRAQIQKVTERPLRDLVADENSGIGLPKAKAETMPDEKLDRMVPKFASEDFVHIVVAGSDAGKFSGAFHGWASGEIGSQPVSRKIEDG
ncbi:MAG: TlpA family protein disulfide reductase [Alphaproteobacteria bacterium]